MGSVKIVEIGDQQKFNPAKFGRIQYIMHTHIHTYITYINVSWCGGESWVDQRVPRAYIHDVALLL